MKAATTVLVVTLAVPFFLPVCAAAQNAAAAATPEQRSAANSDPHTFALKDGIPVKLRTAQAISSRDECTGDTVELQVVDEVRVGGKVVIPRGAPASGTISSVSRRHIARGDALQLSLATVRLANGRDARLRAIEKVEGGGRKGRMTAILLTAGLTTAFAPVIPYALLTHGKAATIPAGTDLTGWIDGDLVLDEALFNSPSPALLAGLVPASHPERVAFAISTDPQGASISIDGKNVGVTPMCTHLLPGEHRLEIVKSGYKTRKETVTASTHRIDFQTRLKAHP